jgi:hypothetical protein
LTGNLQLFIVVAFNNNWVIAPFSPSIGPPAPLVYPPTVFFPQANDGYTFIPGTFSIIMNIQPRFTGIEEEWIPGMSGYLTYLDATNFSGLGGDQTICAFECNVSGIYNITNNTGAEVNLTSFTPSDTLGVKELLWLDSNIAGSAASVLSRGYPGYGYGNVDRINLISTQKFITKLQAGRKYFFINPKML